MLDETIIDLVLALYSIFIAVVFLVMLNKKAYPILWFFGTLVSAFGSVIFYFRHIEAVYRAVGNIIYLIGAVFILFSVLQEYRQKTSKSNKKPFVTFVSLLLIYIIVFLQASSMFIINMIQTSFCVVLIFVIILMIKVYLIDKSITHIFMLMSMISALLLLIFSIFSNLEIQGSWEIAYVIKFIFFTAILVTGFSAPIEEKLKKTESNFRESLIRAEFYKDLFIHDMNNILQGILTSNELLELLKSQLSDPAKLTKYTDITSKQIERGIKLINNVKKLSLLETQKLSLEKLEVYSLLEKAINFLKTTFQNADIEIQITSEITKIYIFGNELILDVFENLLINSVVHNKNPIIKITIKISIIKKNNINYFKMEFIDNGIGVEDYRKPIILQRVEQSLKKTKGMGLGLSLVKKIVENFNGTIWVEDAVKGDYSQGSNFILLIPEAFTND